MEALPPIDPSVDYRKILPIQQKRIITFINHFVIDTVSLLNKFAQSCESKLMDFEYKVQKVEASLLILESQLSSVPDLDVTGEIKCEGRDGEQPIELELPQVSDVEEKQENSDGKGREQETASEDPKYARFFKMLQVGVPLPHVQHKMEMEGLDSSILTSANSTLP